MRASVVAMIAAATVATASLFRSRHGRWRCYVVRRSADARKPRVSTERAEHRLHRHILHETRHMPERASAPFAPIAPALPARLRRSSVITRREAMQLGVKRLLIVLSAVALLVPLAGAVRSSRSSRACDAFARDYARTASRQVRSFAAGLFGGLLRVGVGAAAGGGGAGAAIGGGAGASSGCPCGAQPRSEDHPLAAYRGPHGWLHPCKCGH